MAQGSIHENPNRILLLIKKDVLHDSRMTCRNGDGLGGEVAVRKQAESMAMIELDFYCLAHEASYFRHIKFSILTRELVYVILFPFVPRKEGVQRLMPGTVSGRDDGFVFDRAANMFAAGLYRLNEPVNVVIEVRKEVGLLEQSLHFTDANDVMSLFD